MSSRSATPSRSSRAIGALRLAFFRLVYRRSGIEGVANRLRTVGDPAPILRAFGAHIGENTIVYPGVIIHAAKVDFSNLWIGDYCRVLRDCFLDLTDRIILKDHSGLGPRSTLLTHLYVPDLSPIRDYVSCETGPIVLERGAVLFTNGTITHGVTLGERCMVGAGCVIREDVPADHVVMSAPVRKIRLRRESAGSDKA